MHNSMDSENDRNGASVKVPPPLIFVVWILVASGVDYFWPVPVGNLPVLKYVGIFDVVVGLGLILLGKRSFARAGTNIQPWKPTIRLVSTGVFAYSRNPIYLALCLMSIGMGALLNSLWVLLSFAPSVAIVYYLAVRKEEAYLEEKFGEEYIEYKKHVRRWL